MTKDNKDVRKQKAESLREQIAGLTNDEDQAKTVKEQETRNVPDRSTRPSSPRDFIYRRMRELDENKEK